MEEEAEPYDFRSEDLGSGTGEELLAFLPEASGRQERNVSRLAAWLLQTLQWMDIDELQMNAEATLEQLPQGQLIRIFTEALTALPGTRRLNLENNLRELMGSNQMVLGEDICRRASLCLAALVMAVDSSACVDLWEQVVPWGLESMQAYPQDAALRFWWCAVLIGLDKACRTNGLESPQAASELAISPLLKILNAAVANPDGRDDVACRMAVEAAARALTGLWRGAEGKDAQEQALRLLSAAALLPTAGQLEGGQTWAHGALPALVSVCRCDGGVNGDACREVRGTLTAVISHSGDPAQLAASVRSFDSLLKLGQPVDGETAEWATGVSAALEATYRFPEFHSLQVAGAMLKATAAGMFEALEESSTSGPAIV